MLFRSIKWPNDVLLEGRKVGGVLAEADWEGDRLSHLVLGIGVNVRRGSVPEQGLAFAATCVEEHAGRVVSRVRLTTAIVQSLEQRFAQIGSARFLQAWEDRLAYMGEAVRVEMGEETWEGRLLGLGPEGEARLLLADGREVSCTGEARSLRPMRSGQ